MFSKYFSNSFNSLRLPSWSPPPKVKMITLKLLRRGVLIYSLYQTSLISQNKLWSNGQQFEISRKGTLCRVQKNIIKVRFGVNGFFPRHRVMSDDCFMSLPPPSHSCKSTVSSHILLNFDPYELNPFCHVVNTKIDKTFMVH